MVPRPLFVDTGAVDLLVDPPNPGVVKFWKRYLDAGVKHCISDIVYWEYLRQFSPQGNSLGRQRFLKLVKNDGLHFLPFARSEAEIGVRIYQGIKRILPKNARSKARLKELQCDIMIASTAVSHHHAVVTVDLEDWALIRQVVESGKLGILPLIDRKDMQ